MEEAIAKADALIEAMEYIRRFSGRIVVVKLGGSILDDTCLQKKLLTDIAFMATVGMQPIIVHGGGKAITKAMNEVGLEAVWVQGRRYTDERTLTIVEHTLVHKINTPICETLEELNCKAMGLHSLSSCVLFAEVLRLAGENGRKVDLGLVGEVVKDALRRWDYTGYCISGQRQGRREVKCQRRQRGGQGCRRGMR
jgi:acetylglutamate kinase